MKIKKTLIKATALETNLRKYIFKSFLMLRSNRGHLPELVWCFKTGIHKTLLHSKLHLKLMSQHINIILDVIH